MQMQFGDIKNRFLQFPFILYPSLPSKLIVLNLFIPRQLAMAQMQWSNFSKLNYRNFASSEFFLGAILIFFFCFFITRCSNASNAFDHQRCKKSLAKDIFGSFIRMVFVSTKSFCPALDCCCPPGQRERERCDVLGQAARKPFICSTYVVPQFNSFAARPIVVKRTQNERHDNSHG